MSRRSTGFGRIQSLVELPAGASVADGQELPTPRRPVRLAASGEPTSTFAPPVPRQAPDAAVPEAGRGDPLPGPAIADADALAAAPIGSAPGGTIGRDDAESLSAFLDRRLADARYLLLPNRSRAYAVSKRIVDLVLSIALIVLFSPVLAVLVVLIRLDSPGPAIFCQERVTLGGRIFRFYKFRTMFTDARERFPELYDYRLSRGEFESAYYKLADDPRNTRVGRWLRRTTLDELPNLFNVVTGDLSLVGPRPDLPAFVRLYRPEELCCLFTKAGLTGVAQVAGRSLLTVRERLTLDMRYVAQQTLLLDLRILWRTVVVVLSGRGAF